MDNYFDIPERHPRGFLVLEIAEPWQPSGAAEGLA